MSVKATVILGLARQGIALARYYASLGGRVIVSDTRTADELTGALDELAGLDVEYALGGHPQTLLDHCELLCLSGGVSPEIPLVQEALRRGIPLSNDAQEFINRCPAPVVGITGSAGKTTTTTLTGRMLAASGLRTWVGGNIGNPLMNDLSAIQATDCVVMELSSFQLELMTAACHVAGVLNITPNHLDRHKTMEAYIAAKRRIVANQEASDIAVLGYDEPNARALAQETLAQVRYFSGHEAVAAGAFLHDDDLVLRNSEGDTRICKHADVQLRGFHNVLNVLAAVTLADAAGANPDGIREAIRDFSGVSHRLEEVRRRQGVLWINDSIATAPERVLAALDAFEEPLILLAGGRDKDLPWEAFARRVIRRVRVVILFGEAGVLIGGHIERAWRAAQESGEGVVLQELQNAGTLDNAVAMAAHAAQAGDVVLLSPGGTSFDAYRDFAERGERYRALVQALP